MEPHQQLALLSSVQLTCGLAGFALAVARRHAYDVPLMRGRPDRVVRDSVLMGTALSAPVTMLVTQSVLTGLVAKGSNRRAERVLGALGALMVAGYLGERLVRHRLTPSGWDGFESPVVTGGLVLAAAMATAGLGSRE